MTTEPRVEWKWGALATLALIVIALYPQINLWLARGKQWHGSYVMTQGDEVMYSAYVNALIEAFERPVGRRWQPLSAVQREAVHPKAVPFGAPLGGILRSERTHGYSAAGMALPLDSAAQTQPPSATHGRTDQHAISVNKALANEAPSTHGA